MAPMSVEKLNDARVREIVEAMIRRLQALLDDHETHASLKAWAVETWRSAGEYWQGPIALNRTATHVLGDLLDADARMPPGDAAAPHVLRREDIVRALDELRRGVLVPPLAEIGVLRCPLPAFIAALDLPTERHILDGLGWYEYQQFASPGTGRVFVLSGPIDHPPSSEYGPQIAANRSDDGVNEVLLDLFETLEIDLADIALYDAFTSHTLPELHLWRQPADGAPTLVATFTGLRKAMAALRRCEAAANREPHWLEGR